MGSGKDDERMKNSKHSSLLALVLIVALLISLMSGMAMATSGSEIDFTKVDNAELPDAVLANAGAEAPEETPEYADTDSVRIFVVMAKASAMEAGFSTKDIASNQKAMAYVENLEKLQKDVAEDIAENVITDGSFQVEGNLRVIADAFTADIRYGDIAKLEAYLTETYGEDFAGVYIVPQFEVMNDETADPQMMTAGTMVGAPNAWAAGYTGAGSRVAIIDTGLDTDHPSFDPDAYHYALQIDAIENGKSVSDYRMLTVSDIEKVLPLLNAKTRMPALKATDLYRNEKLAYAFNYIDKGLDVTHDNDTQGDHGTHVSGIAASNTYVKHVADNGAVSFVKQENGVCGVAPNAQIMTMKVFGRGGGAYASDYMEAIEDAVLLGADAVNLSLGSAVPGKSYSGVAYTDKIMDSLVNSDTVVAFSAGNNSYWAEHNVANDVGLNYAEDVSQQTGGSPGSMKNSFTVASAVNTSLTGFGGTFSGLDVVVSDPGTAPTNMNPWSTLDTTADLTGTEYPYVFLGNPKDANDTKKFGTAADYEGVDVTGKIVLVSRGGGVSFADKHMAAFNAGAAAVVVYNNASGSISMSLQGSTASTPCVFMLQSNAMDVLERSTQDASGLWSGKVLVKGKVTTMPMSDGYTMSDFSSWGTTGDLAIKPEITAPGGNIYSTLNNGTYGVMSGTSMAAPSITGQSAVVAQYIREKGLAEKTGLTQRALVMSLLMSTAVPLTDPESNLPYSVRNQGAGLGNAGLAVSSPAYILMDESSCASAADGKVKAELGEDAKRTGSYAFSFNVYNITDKDLTYVPSADVLTPDIITEDGVDYLSLSMRSLSADVSYETEGAGASYLYDFNQDGVVDLLDAQYLNDCVAGVKALSDEAAAAADFNADGVVNSVDTYLFLEMLTNDAANAATNKIIVKANSSVKVTVRINLSEADRAYLAEKDPNGNFVEGYVYLNGDVTLSVPFMAFYGNYTESSMFDRASYMEHYYGLDDKDSYVMADSKVNVLTMRPNAKSSKTYIFGFNLYATDEDFIPERNYVFSATAGGSIYQAAPTLIRSVGRMETTISNAETGEVYYSVQSAPSSAYWYANGSAWSATSSTVRLGGNYGWLGTDAEGNPLPDGTKVNVTCTAAPELDTHKNEDGTWVIDKEKLASGAYLTKSFVIDNTAPEIKSVYYSDDLWGNNDYLTITVQDNRYVAALLLANEKGDAVLARTNVEQSALGETTQVRMDIGNVSGNKFTLIAIDYAGNTTAGSISLASSGRDDGDNPGAEPDNNIYGVVTGSDGKAVWATVDMSAIKTTKVADVTSISAAVECAAFANDNIYGNVSGTIVTMSSSNYAVTAAAKLVDDWNFSDITYLPTMGKCAVVSSEKFGLMDMDSMSINYFDLSSIIDTDTLVGATYMFTQTDATYGEMDVCLLVTNTGRTLLWAVYQKADGGYSARYGDYDTIGVACNEDLHSQGLMYDRSTDKLYYTVGAKIYNVYLEKSGTKTVAKARLMGQFSGAQSVLALFMKQDEAVKVEGATETQMIADLPEMTEFAESAVTGSFAQ